MTVYGILTKKSSAINPEFDNRYYVQRNTLSEALTDGANLGALEMDIFGSGVTFVGSHAWLPGSSPRQYGNSPQAVNGAIATASPFKSEIVVRVTWGALGANPSFKNYRVQVGAAYLNGINWGDTYLDLLDAFILALIALGIPLCTKTGTLLGTPTVDPEYEFQQTGKAWYNQGT